MFCLDVKRGPRRGKHHGSLEGFRLLDPIRVGILALPLVSSMTLARSLSPNSLICKMGIISTLPCNEDQD